MHEIDTEPETLFITLSLRKPELNVDYLVSAFSLNVPRECIVCGVNYLGIKSEHLGIKPDLDLHLDWLFKFLGQHEALIRECQERHVELDISCYWACTSFNTCPALSLPQIEQLNRYRLAIFFDIYFLS